MPITELRDGITIQQFDGIGSPSGLKLDGNGFGIIQKKINVVANRRHKLEHCDFYIDSLGLGYQNATFYLTPLPLIYSDMQYPFGFGQDSGIVPAYNENVLYKCKFNSDEFRGLNESEFPNNFLAARPTFNFYSDTLYLTILFNGVAGEEVTNLIVSFYAAMDSTPIDSVEHGIGLLKERMTMMTSRIDSLGRSIPPSRNVGQIAPFWKYGGTRPERMITGDSLVNFWLNMADRDDEDMSDPTLLRDQVQSARVMVDNPKAMGRNDVPDWIRLYLNEGLVAGPIRPQWPPIKHADNGNVLTL